MGSLHCVCGEREGATGLVGEGTYARAVCVGPGDSMLQVTQHHHPHISADTSATGQLTHFALIRPNPPSVLFFSQEGRRKLSTHSGVHSFEASRSHTLLLRSAAQFGEGFEGRVELTHRVPLLFVLCARQMVVRRHGHVYVERAYTQGIGACRKPAHHKTADAIVLLRNQESHATHKGGACQGVNPLPSR